jgi:hypothetical protein
MEGISLNKPVKYPFRGESDVKKIVQIGWKNWEKKGAPDAQFNIFERNPDSIHSNMKIPKMVGIGSYVLSSFLHLLDFFCILISSPFSKKRDRSER